jgi:hypothetical protein
MTDKERILSEFDLFSLGTGGIGDWLMKSTDDTIFARLASIDHEPLRKVQLNQLLVLGHQAPVSDDFFHYYWLDVPATHPYDVKTLPDYNESWGKASEIVSLGHLKWGLYRLFTDGLLWFGNVRAGYRFLRSMTADGLAEFFGQRRFDAELIRNRGPALKPRAISKDDRYLISEMACKSYGDQPSSQSDLKLALLKAFQVRGGSKEGPIKIRRLLEGDFLKGPYQARQTEFVLAADDVLEESVDSEQAIEEKIDRVATKFFEAREAALNNTRLFLSMVTDLDVYVATSMRTRKDFRDMADFCDEVFSHASVTELQLRYFNPTLSAAAGHEDKGLIECLMVKCAKVLIYCAGDKESYGKDAEAAMALSLGKPVIFYCDQELKARFYRDIHPLSRLIDFATGVAVGAIVTDSKYEVAELLSRMFENRMVYRLEKPKAGYLKLKETLTDSVVRLQTSDKLLTETFWNHFHATSF